MRFYFQAFTIRHKRRGSQNKRDEKVNTWGRCLNEKERIELQNRRHPKGQSADHKRHTP